MCMPFTIKMLWLIVDHFDGDPTALSASCIFSSLSQDQQHFITG